MDLDILDAYIANEVSEEIFLEGIRTEILDFIAGINSEGNTLQIIGSRASYNEFGSSRLLSLLYKYLDGNICEWELEYILRVLEFTFEKEDERVENVIFSFSDPYLNYNINEANIKSAVKYLTGCTEKMKLLKDKNEKIRLDYDSVFTPPLHN